MSNRSKTKPEKQATPAAEPRAVVEGKALGAAMMRVVEAARGASEGARFLWEVPGSKDPGVVMTIARFSEIQRSIAWFNHVCVEVAAGRLPTQEQAAAFSSSLPGVDPVASPPVPPVVPRT